MNKLKTREINDCKNIMMTTPDFFAAVYSQISKSIDITKFCENMEKVKVMIKNETGDDVDTSSLRKNVYYARLSLRIKTDSPTRFAKRHSSHHASNGLMAQGLRLGCALRGSITHPATIIRNFHLNVWVYRASAK
jgi:hypothetical protein